MRIRFTLCVVLISLLTMAAFSANVIGAVRVRHTRAADDDNRNVVVWLTPLDAAATPGSAPAHYTITQRDKQFAPHITVVPVGTKIEFPNKDPFFHNVFSLYMGKRFDLGLYEAGSSRQVLFDRPGVSFIFCNIHPNMSAYVLAVETPYFETTGKEGHISIADVQPGRYRLHVWYERAESSDLEKLSRDIDITDAEVNLGEIQIAESPRFQPEHANKHGKPYDPEQMPY